MIEHNPFLLGVVEEESALLPGPVEKSPACREISIEEWISLFTGPEPAHTFLPEPDPGILNRVRKEPAQLLVQNPTTLFGLVEISKPWTAPPTWSFRIFHRHRPRIGHGEIGRDKGFLQTVVDTLRIYRIGDQIMLGPAVNWKKVAAEKIIFVEGGGPLLGIWIIFSTDGKAAD